MKKKSWLPHGEHQTQSSFLHFHLNFKPNLEEILGKILPVVYHLSQYRKPSWLTGVRKKWLVERTYEQRGVTILLWSEDTLPEWLTVKVKQLDTLFYCSRIFIIWLNLLRSYQHHKAIILWSLHLTKEETLDNSILTGIPES